MELALIKPPLVRHRIASETYESGELVGRGGRNSPKPQAPEGTRTEHQITSAYFHLEEVARPKP